MAMTLSGSSGITFNNGSAQDVGGVGTGSQTWQSLIGSRVSGTTYTNTTGKPIMVNAHGITGGAGNAGLQGYVDGLLIASNVPYANSANYGGLVSMIVPNGSNYSVNWGGSSGSLTLWAELR
jgi:hypothetical protein